MNKQKTKPGVAFWATVVVVVVLVGIAAYLAIFGNLLKIPADFGDEGNVRFSGLQRAD
jgi:hypothetical protein